VAAQEPPRTDFLYLGDQNAMLVMGGHPDADGALTAIVHRNQTELLWALSEIELRKRFLRGHSSRLNQLESAFE
jgi:hypothetical protein